MAQQPTFVERFRRAFALTSYYAGAFLFLFLLQHLLTEGAVARRVGMSVGQIVALHMGAVLIVALVIASCHRVLRTRVGAIAIGGILAAPLGVLFSLIMYPKADIGQHALAALIVGVALGCTSGAVYWDRPKS